MSFPRILGIEAVGTITAAPGYEVDFPEGGVVATCMGGMGRNFDGGYAEYCVVPSTQVQLLKNGTKIPWRILGAIPEMMQTAWGALFTCLKIENGDRLLIRGGTTSVGLAAISIAKMKGAEVTATTRRADRVALLKEHGADSVIIDAGSVMPAARESNCQFNKVLEMIGVSTLIDSLQCLQPGGTVCLVGSVCDKWSFEEGFSPSMAIPTAVNLTAYHSSTQALMDTPLDDIIDWISGGDIKIPVKVFHGIESVVDAHRCMENNEAGGKIVVLLD